MNQLRESLRGWFSLIAPISGLVAFFLEITIDHYQHLPQTVTVVVVLLTFDRVAQARGFRVELTSSDPKIPTMRVEWGNHLGSQSDAGRLPNSESKVRPVQPLPPSPRSSSEPP